VEVLPCRDEPKAKNMKAGTQLGAGFTLVEVILAALILSLGLLAVVRVLPVGLKAQKRAEEMTLAYLVAREMIEEVRLVGYEALVSGTRSGSTEGIRVPKEEGGYPGCQWRVYWNNTDTPGLAEVRVVVLSRRSGSGSTMVDRDEASSSQRVELVTLLAGRTKPEGG